MIAETPSTAKTPSIAETPSTAKTTSTAKTPPTANNSLSMSRVVADMAHVPRVCPPNTSISTEVGVDDNTVAL